jgi:hypothetical protein
MIRHGLRVDAVLEDRVLEPVVVLVKCWGESVHVAVSLIAASIATFAAKCGIVMPFSASWTER